MKSKGGPAYFPQEARALQVLNLPLGARPVPSRPVPSISSAIARLRLWLSIGALSRLLGATGRRELR